MKTLPRRRSGFPTAISESAGIVLICPSAVADAKMRMFNADGSEGKMCGNAIRCVGKYLYDFRKTDKTQLKIETLSGIKTLFLSVADGETTSVRVDMGAPELAPKNIPVLSGTSFPVVGRETEIAGGKYAITCVSMGNPHCVVFSDPDAWEIEKTGPMFENAPIFPERTNLFGHAESNFPKRMNSFGHVFNGAAGFNRRVFM